jgi:hypothetical protein
MRYGLPLFMPLTPVSSVLGASQEGVARAETRVDEDAAAVGAGSAGIIDRRNRSVLFAIRILAALCGRR